MTLAARKRHRFRCWMDCQRLAHHLGQQTFLLLGRHAFLDRVHAQAADLISSKTKQFGLAVYSLCLLDFYFAYKAYMFVNAREVRQSPREDHNEHYVDDQDRLTQYKNPISFFLMVGSFVCISLSCFSYALYIWVGLVILLEKVPAHVWLPIRVWDSGHLCGSGPGPHAATPASILVASGHANRRN